MGLWEITLVFICGTGLPVPIDGRVAAVSGDSPADTGYYIPYDTIFSSWLMETPNFHMLGELPPQLPEVQVFCNGSQMSLLVDKIFNGVLLKEEDLQLGDGCYRNGDLKNQLVFTYDFVQCGTNHEIQNGMDVFSNLLHFNSRKSLTWWPTPFAMPISCISKRSEENLPSAPVSVALPSMETGGRVSLKAMNESNIYRRGQNVHLQVTANPGSDQKPFIHSCFISASPDPKTHSRAWLIVNKGCTASDAVTQFVPSRSEDAVNFILNTSHLVSAVHIHCSVLLSDKGITPDSKSCNYKMQSRWEDLTGNAEVCSCCSSKCKGSSLKHYDAKVVVGTGPLVILDVTSPTSIQEWNDPSSTPVFNSMQSDLAVPGVTEYQTTSNALSRSGVHSGPKGGVMYGAAFSQSYFESNGIPEAPSLPKMAEEVLMLSRRPGTAQTLWLPGHVHITDPVLGEVQNSPLQSKSPGELELSATFSNEIPPLHLGAPGQRFFSPSTNEMRDKQLNEADGDSLMGGVNGPSMVDGWQLHVQDGWPVPLIPMLDGWQIPPKPEESPRKLWGMMPRTRTQERYKAWPVDAMNDMNLHEGSVDHKGKEFAQRQVETLLPKQGDDGAVRSVRSKLLLSRAMDGSQTLSYEEELKPVEGLKKTRRFEVNDIVDQRKRGTGQRGFLSTFLDLLRKLDTAE